MRATLAFLGVMCSIGAVGCVVLRMLGEFEMLANVEGEAMCIRCRRTTPKAGMFYSKSLDAYYHPECLARDSRK